MLILKRKVPLSPIVLVAFIFLYIVPPVQALGTPQITKVEPQSPSPVGTCVKIRAKVDWDSEFRAMRIRFGNEGWQEEATSEFERTFCTSDLPPGTYTIRIEVARKGDNSWSNPTVAEASYQLLPASPQSPPPVTGISPSLVVGSTSVVTGQSVTVSWGALDSSGNDWTSLHPVNTPDSSYLSWQRVNGSSGSLTFTAPSTPGWYEFRLFRNGPKVATSNAFEVRSSSPPAQQSQPEVTSPTSTQPQPPAQPAPSTQPSNPPVSKSSSGSTLSATTRLNVRTGPGINYSRITTISADQTYRMTGKNGNSLWLQIDYNGRPGWVCRQYTTADGAEVSVLPMTDGSTFDCAGRARLTAIGAWFRFRTEHIACAVFSIPEKVFSQNPRYTAWFEASDGIRIGAGLYAEGTGLETQFNVSTPPGDHLYGVCISGAYFFTNPGDVRYASQMAQPGNWHMFVMMQ